ncbi:MAG: class I SAM-dependent rRNA methyltransferase [Algoriphagus sp.]|uniref:class I SAM-dependent rRNA methyltransferase n=1 Tax=Algoriphagus sp. TaxID=1872435 RepID=UPI002731824A|nr:class I SAM-dependent rRNA methyltransferase [Algoriphagus sp.]MDP2042146.1 class I SAM-dependent rRNA methyltransferase [Algoriphagus sp.]MDP3470479.1 class I SAM-dependent rRNA methyltransferase [Algoriphagus sp.]
MSYPKIILQRSKEFSLQRRHHWVFSGAIAKADPGLESGDLVSVYSAKDEFLGIGHFSQGSIMVRIISFEDRAIDQAFWNEKIASAYALRKNLGLTDNEKTNVFRLVHGEGDLLPGLIVDYYNGTAVIQAHHIGIHKNIAEISAALQVVLGEKLKGVYDKSAETLPKNLGIESNEWVWGRAETDLVQEYGATYRIDWEKGQKTGFFIDQRENRKLVSTYSNQKKVLNTFCYSGGFSVLALNEGASEVHSVDISSKAIALTEQNVGLNPGFKGKHESIVADVVKYIREIGDDFDLIVLDPPAFAKNIKARHNAVQAYKRLNAEAIRKIKPGGIIFTFSCSQVVDKSLFTHTIAAAAMETGRKVKVLHQLSQPADHPINIFHPETEYLKGLVLYIE